MHSRAFIGNNLPMHEGLQMVSKRNAYTTFHNYTHRLRGILLHIYNNSSGLQENNLQEYGDADYQDNDSWLSRPHKY